MPGDWCFIPYHSISRVLVYEPSGREFESLRARQKRQRVPNGGPLSFSASREFELCSPKGCVRTEERSDDRRHREAVRPSLRARHFLTHFHSVVREFGRAGNYLVSNSVCPANRLTQISRTITLDICVYLQNDLVTS